MIKMKFDFKAQPNMQNYCKLTEIDNFVPQVSIITPFYNSGEYILDTAKCVLNQSFPWFEWIIIDDGSTDEKSLKILEKLKKTDKRIKIFHKSNSGLASTRDYGCEKSNKLTKYFLFLDDDDLLETNYIECNYWALETNQNAAFSYTNTIGFGAQEYLWDKKFNIKTQIRENQLVATALIRRDAYDLVDGYNLKEKGINEDWIFWTKLFTKSKIPLKLNYYGFWYRRKLNGELKKSQNNKEKTLSILNQYIDNVDLNLKAIEYPQDNYDWNDVFKNNFIFKKTSKIQYSKKNIIFIMPHIVMGGADKFNIDFLKGLNNEEYFVTAVLTNVSDNNWISELKKYVDNYYILPSFLERKNWNTFIAYLIDKNDSKLIFNTNSLYGYMCLPYLKNKFPNIKIIDYVHMEEWYNRNGGYSRDSSSISSIIDKTLTCNNNSTNILKEYFNRKQDDVETVYIGVDEKYFKNDLDKNALKLKYNIPNDKIIVSFIARLAYQKRPYLLMEIIKKLKKHKEILFLICGDGDLLNSLEKVAIKYKITENLKFLGRIDNPKEIYAISDMTLNCSIKEGLALTTYESLSMGVPVVSTNVGGQKEIIDDSVGAIINTKQKEEDIYILKYDEKEIEQFSNSILTISKNLEKYKSKCRNKILNGFTISDMNKKMNKIIDNVIASKNKKLFDNEDIAKELLNQHLLESKKDYDWSINEFYKKYGYINANSKSILAKILDKLIYYGYKFHIYYELRVLFDILIEIKNLIVNIFRILKLIIKLPYLIIKRFYNLIVKIFKRNSKRK